MEVLKTFFFWITFFTGIATVILIVLFFKILKPNKKDKSKIAELENEKSELENRIKNLEILNKETNIKLQDEEKNLNLDVEDLKYQKEDLSNQIQALYDKKNELTQNIKNRINFWKVNEFQYIDSLSADGHEFEEYVCNLYKMLGYQAEVTPASGDRGVDVLVYDGNLKIAVQCKCYSQPIGNHAVQEVFSGKEFYNCDKGVVITNNYFTDRAIEIAKVHNIELIDKDKLTEMIDKAYFNSFNMLDNLHNIK